MLRAPESGEVSAAVRGWLTGQGYGAVTDGGPPERLSGGADFWVYGLQFAGPGLPQPWSAPLVARVPLAGYRRVLPVDRERVRLWRPVSLLAIWSAAEASQRGFFGSEPRLPAGLIGWAAREFRRAAPGTG